MDKNKSIEDLKVKIYKLLLNLNIEIEREKLIKQKINETLEDISTYKADLAEYGITYEDPK